MPRKLRVEYAGAMYHVMSRGDRREAIFLEDVDRQDFLKTLAEACQKTDWQIHAYCLMSNQKRKLAIAARLRKETTLSIKAIAGRMHLGHSKGANTNLHKWMRARAAESPAQVHRGL